MDCKIIRRCGQPAGEARYPTLLCGGCGGEAGTHPAPRSQLGKDLNSPVAGDDPAGRGGARVEDDTAEPDVQRLSARSAGYLEREAKELLRLQGKGAAVQDWVPYTFDSGAVYTGEWSGGMRHGYGRQTWPDGTTYEGQWSEGSASGSGRFVHRGGDVFEGQWRQNVASGLGAYYRRAPELKVMIVGISGLGGADTYCTCEVAGKPYSRFQTGALGPGAGARWEHEAAVAACGPGDGLAFAVRGRGGELLGRARLAGAAFQPGGFDGELRLRARRGARALLRVRVAAACGAYVGEWAEDCQHGYGVETWSEGWGEGTRYAGEFAHGQKHGFGTYRWADGSVYEGQWSRNMIEGDGAYSATDGRCFKGQWRESVIHGFGRYLWPGGRWYSGHYVLDQKHGFGTFHWPDGRKYEGFWADGKQDGLGRLTTKAGSTRLSFWESGRRVSDLEQDG